MKRGSVQWRRPNAAGSHVRRGAVQAGSSGAPEITGPASIASVVEDLLITPVTFTATGSGTLTWSSTSLPTGMAFSSGGVLSGTPTTPGNTSVTFTVTDPLLRTDTVTFTLTITVAGGIQITTAQADIPSLFLSQLMTPITLEATGGSGSRTWTVRSGGSNVALGTIVPGLSLSSGGVISGTPTALDAGVQVTFRVTDTGGHDDVTFTLRVVAQPAAGAWPDTSGANTIGLNFTGTNTDQDLFWSALTAAGKNQLTSIRIQAAWSSIEPNPPSTAGAHTYVWGSMDAKVNWCRAHGKRVIFDFTYTPKWATITPTYPNAVITNVGGKGRITIPGLDGGQYDDILIHDAGNVLIPVGTMCTGQTATYVDVDKACTPGTTTVIFGPYKNGATWVTGRFANNQLPPRDECLPDAARAVAALLNHFNAEDNGDIEIETGNELNSSGWYKPHADAVRYSRWLRYLYRACLETSPKTIVLTTGVSGGIDLSGSWNDTPSDFMQKLFRQMRQDTDWRDWIEDSAGDFTPFSTTNMAALLAAGRISPCFYVDRACYHMYKWGRGGNSLGADNHYNWSDAVGGDAPEHTMRMFNHMYQLDPWEVRKTGGPTGGNFVLGIKVGTGSVQNSNTIAWNATDAAYETAIEATTDVPAGTVTVTTLASGARLVEFGGSLINTIVRVTLVTNSLTGGTNPNVAIRRHGLDRMLLTSTETGGPFNTFAVTGRGWTGGGANRDTDPQGVADVKGIASQEEMYVQLTVFFQVWKKARAFPSGGGIPAALGDWDPRERLGNLCIFRTRELQETPEVTQATRHSAHMGFVSGFVAGPAGPDQIQPGELKRALSSQRPRPYLNGTNFPSLYTNALIGSGADAIDAMNTVWGDSTGTPVIDTASLPDATVGQAYTTTMASSGGSGTVVWSVTGLSGTGLSINSTTGVISGTVTGTPGDKSVTVSLTVGGVAATPRTYTLTVQGTSTLTITTTSPLAPATIGSAYEVFVVATGGDPTTYSWSATGLPTGMTINTTANKRGRISATSVGGTAGNKTVTVTVTDSTGTVNKDLVIAVGAAGSALTITTTQGQVDAIDFFSDYVAVFTATGGTGFRSWDYNWDGGGRATGNGMGNGLDGNGTLSGQGLPYPGDFTNVTLTASTDLIAATAHGLTTGDQLRFTFVTGATTPDDITTYYVIASGLTADAFKISTTRGGSTINIDANGTGQVIRTSGELTITVTDSAGTPDTDSATYDVDLL